MKFIFNVFAIKLILSTILMVNSFIFNLNKSEIDTGKKVKKSVVIKDKNQLWFAGIIPYETEGLFDESQLRLIKLGMKIWEESTCIKFVERDPLYHRDYVAIVKLDCGCCYIENVQRNKGRSELSLNDDCNELTVVLHELGHVLGFYHEHEHPDRDHYVQIQEHNVERGYRQEFGKFSSSQVDTLGQPYDYQSVMHYPNNAFAYFEYLKTIVPIRLVNGTFPKIGNKVKLSDGDISAANNLYKCSECDRTLHDSKGSFQSPNFKNDFIICDWKIPVQSGGKVALKILSLNIPESSGCFTDYLEVRKGFSDTGTLLGRYCGSQTNLLIIDEDMLVKYVRTHRSSEDDHGFTADYYKTCSGEKFLMSNDPIILQSPNYPSDYEPNSECLWELIAPKDHQTTIRFDYFSLESTSNCSFDSVRIGTIDEMEFLGIYCGEFYPWQVVLENRKFFFLFTSDKLYQSAGFSATITAVPITNSAITSPFIKSINVSVNRY